MDWFYNWVVSGADFVATVQQFRTPALDAFFHAATFFGEESAYLLLLLAFYWLLNRKFGRELVYLLLVTVFLNIFFKNLFKLPRPFQVDSRIVPMVSETSYGLPSGHAMLPAALWGTIAWYYRRYGWWITPAAVLGILIIAFSRLYLGVHFPADTLAGLALGAIILLLWLKYRATLASLIAHTDDRWLLALGAFIPLVVLFALPGDAFGYPPEAGATVAGLLAGVTIGFIFEETRVRFRVDGAWGRRGLRFLVGLVFVAAFWMGLKVLFGLFPVGYTAALILRLVRYTITGVALTWWAPAAFVRFGLAETEIDPE